MLIKKSRLGHKNNHRFLKVLTERKETLYLPSVPEVVARTSVFDDGRLNINGSIAVKHAAAGTSSPPLWRSHHAHIHSRLSLTRGVAATCTPLDAVRFPTSDRHLRCTTHKADKKMSKTYIYFVPRNVTETGLWSKASPHKAW